MNSCHSGGGGSRLTHDIEVVGVIDGPVLILHHAGVISFVGWDHAFHNEAPVLVSYLKETEGARRSYNELGTEHQALRSPQLKSRGRRGR